MLFAIFIDNSRIQICVGNYLVMTFLCSSWWFLQWIKSIFNTQQNGCYFLQCLCYIFYMYVSCNIKWSCLFACLMFSLHTNKRSWHRVADLTMLGFEINTLQCTCTWICIEFWPWFGLDLVLHQCLNQLLILCFYCFVTNNCPFAFPELLPRYIVRSNILVGPIQCFWLVWWILYFCRQ